VIEGFGLRGFGAHTTNAEYILVKLHRAAPLSHDAHDHGHIAG
jgi:hypothetical protein